MTVKVEKSDLHNPVRVENPYKGLDYNLLHNIPTVDGKEIKGDMTTEQLIGFDKDYVDRIASGDAGEIVERHNADETAHPYLLEEIVNNIEEHNISTIAHQDIRTAIETLQLVKWVNALPETGESKYIYVVPREETDTEGKQIAALYLWDGSAWRGAGAFSLNIDPDTLATKTELSNYLPKTGGYIVGTLSIARAGGLIDTLMPEEGSGSGYTRLRVYSYDGSWVGYVFHNTVGDASILLVDGGHLNIDVSNNKEVRIRGKRILTIGDKGVANGIASLDANGKVPLSQLPDNIGGGGAPTLKWYKNNTGSTVTIDDTSSSSLVKVYKNGVLLEPEEDYSIDGTTLTLTTALIATDKITTEVF